MAGIFEVVLQSIYLGVKCINRFNYYADGDVSAGGWSALLADAMSLVPSGGVMPSTGWLPTILTIQSPRVRYETVTVRNVYSDTDFLDLAYAIDVLGTLTGTSAETDMHPSLAWGFRTNRVRRDIRRGTHRFVGQNEVSVQYGGAPNTGMIAGLEVVASELGSVFSIVSGGVTIDFSPAVVSKQHYNSTTHDTTPPLNAYRYYPTEAEQLERIAFPVTYEAYLNTRTQVSRQFGHGR